MLVPSSICIKKLAVSVTVFVNSKIGVVVIKVVVVVLVLVEVLLVLGSGWW